MFARDGGGGVFAAVAGAGEDGGEGVHGGVSLSINLHIISYHYLRKQMM